MDGFENPKAVQQDKKNLYQQQQQVEEMRAKYRVQPFLLFQNFMSQASEYCTLKTLGALCLIKRRLCPQGTMLLCLLKTVQVKKRGAWREKRAKRE